MNWWFALPSILSLVFAFLFGRGQLAAQLFDDRRVAPGRFVANPLEFVADFIELDRYVGQLADLPLGRREFSFEHLALVVRLF